MNLWNNCTQNFHLGRCIVRYTVGNLVLPRRASGVVKRNFRMYIRRYTYPKEYLNMVIPILMHFCSLVSNRSVASRKTKKCDVKLFPTVYGRIYMYCRKFLTLSKPISRYKSKCIRMSIVYQLPTGVVKL